MQCAGGPSRAVVKLSIVPVSDAAGVTKEPGRPFPRDHTVNLVNHEWFAGAGHAIAAVSAGPELRPEGSTDPDRGSGKIHFHLLVPQRV